MPFFEGIKVLQQLSDKKITAEEYRRITAGFYPSICVKDFAVVPSSWLDRFLAWLERLANVI